MKTKVLTTLYLTLIFTVLIYGEKLNTHGRIFNFKGWNIPDISKMKKTKIETTKILEDLPPILVEEYEYICNKSKKRNPFYVIPNKSVMLGKIVDLRDDLTTYKKEWVQGLKIFKTENGKKILCYQYYCIRGANISEILKEYLQSIKEESPLIVGGIAGGAVSEYIADLDNDGVFESKFGAINNEYALDSILRSKFKEYKKRTKLEKNLILLKKAWIRYMDYPSSKNAQKVYSLIPDSRSISNLEETEEEKELWNWIWLTLPVLEKEMYAGDRNAVKVAFKLYPIHRGTFSANLDVILAHFARVNPKMFLEELKKHQKLITPKQAIEGSMGLEECGLANVRYLKLQNTLKALKRVKDKSLVNVRDECINYLEKQLEYLKKHYDIKE